MLFDVLNSHECRIRFVHVKGHQPRERSKQARLNGNMDYWAGEARQGRFVNQSHEDEERLVAERLARQKELHAQREAFLDDLAHETFGWDACEGDFF